MYSNWELKYRKVHYCLVHQAVERLCLPRLLQLRHLCHSLPWLAQTLWRCLVVCMDAERVIICFAF